MLNLKRSRSFKFKFFLFLVGLFLIVIIWYQIYMTRDYSAMFIENKGTIINTTETFLDADTMFSNYDLKIQDSNGLEIDCYVRIPKDTTRKHAGLLVMNGFDTGKQVISLFESTEEAVLLSFDWPYEGPRKFKGADMGPFLPRIRRAIFRAVSVVLTMIDYLESRPDVDPSKIFVVGASFGAPFAVNAAAVDARIKAVILLYGGGDIAGMIESSSHKQVTSWIGRKLLGWFVASLLAPVEPLKYIDRISPRPLLMINGRHDQSIFEESAEKLFKQAKQPKKIIWLESQHAKPKMTDLTHQLEKIMKQWLVEEHLM